MNKKTNTRINNFYKILSTYEKNGFHYKKLTITMTKANALSVLLALPLCTLLFLIYYINNGFLRYGYTLLTPFLLLIIFFALIIVHEVIHAFTWGFFSKKKWKATTISIDWKSLTPYCSCNESLSPIKYSIGVAMPLLILGICPGIISIFIANEFLLLLSLMMILSAGGDLIILLLLLKEKNKSKTLILDHPTECGAVMIYKNSLQ